MNNSTQRFISELIRAANEIDKLTKLERANLLRQGAGMIRDIREQINFSETPANETGPGDIVFDLNEMARTIVSISDADVAEAFLDIVETIKAGQILLEAKLESRGEL